MVTPSTPAPRATDPLRVAVVGCGAIAELQHLPALAASRLAKAVVVVDKDLERARASAKRFDVERAVADVGELGAGVDAAIVALPNHLHAPVSIALLRQGIHVLVEKPMAPTVADCDAMIAAALETGAVLAVGLEFRFFDSTELVRELLAEQLVGPLPGFGGFDLRQGVVGRWPFASDFALRKETAGGGVLADFGVHVLDLLLCWLGDWRGVECSDDGRGGVESDAELRLTMESGISGVVEVSRTRSLRNTCRFFGTRGMLEVGIWDPDPEISVRLPGRTLGLNGRARSMWLPDGTPLRASAGRPLRFADAFVRQLDDFVGAIRDHRAPRVPGSEGRRTIELVEACYANRRPLELPWDAPPELARWRSAR